MVHDKNSELADELVFVSQVSLLGFKDRLQSKTLFKKGDEPEIYLGGRVNIDGEKAFEIAQGISIKYGEFWNSLAREDQQLLADAIANDPNKSSTFAAIIEKYNVMLQEV